MMGLCKVDAGHVGAWERTPADEMGNHCLFTKKWW
jgi:hypothetical protein